MNILSLLAQVSEPTSLVTMYPGTAVATIGLLWGALTLTFKALLSATEKRIEEKFADLRRDVTERKEEAGGMRRELNDLKVEVARSLGDLGSKMPNGHLTEAISALASAAEAMHKSVARPTMVRSPRRR
jgi:hypothetical protein